MPGDAKCRGRQHAPGLNKPRSATRWSKRNGCDRQRSPLPLFAVVVTAVVWSMGCGGSFPRAHEIQIFRERLQEACQILDESAAALVSVLPAMDGGVAPASSQNTADAGPVEPEDGGEDVETVAEEPPEETPGVPQDAGSATPQDDAEVTT